MRRVERFVRNFGIVILLAIVASVAWAQKESADFPSIPGNSIHVWNGTDRSVTFYISVDEKSWTKFSLASDDSKTITLGDGIEKAVGAIRTGDSTGKWRLLERNRYRIFWNSDKSAFEFAKMGRES